MRCRIFLSNNRPKMLSRQKLQSWKMYSSIFWTTVQCLSDTFHRQAGDVIWLLIILIFKKKCFSIYWLFHLFTYLYPLIVFVMVYVAQATGAFCSSLNVWQMYFWDLYIVSNNRAGMLTFWTLLFEKEENLLNYTVLINVWVVLFYYTRWQRNSKNKILSNSFVLQDYYYWFFP